MLARTVLAQMRIEFIIKWSLLGTALLAVVAIVLGFTAYRQGRYLGHALDGPAIALVGGRIYDPEGDSIVEDVTVLINGRQIVSLEYLAPLPDTVRVLNVNGLTLLPGFIDSHVHLSGIRPRISDGKRELGWIPYLWRFVRRFPERRRALIEAGITSVKSLGDPYPWIVNLAERIERHELAGPRVFAAGPFLTAPGGHPVERFRRAGQGDPSFIAQVTRQLAGPADAATAVKQLSRDVDFVSAVLETRGDPNLSRMSAPVLRSISSTAHGRDLRVLAHVSSVAEVKLALRTGADGIEHVPFDSQLDSVILSALGERGVFVDPTLQATERLLSELLRDTTGAHQARRNVRLLLEAGVPMVVGSDAPAPGTTFGLTFHEELRNLVEVGYTPGQAIAAATIIAAEHLGVSDSLGSIVPGKWADIIAVGGDPLSDIVAVADIYLVVADGQVLYERLDQVPRARGVIAFDGRQPTSHIRGSSERAN